MRVLQSDPGSAGMYQCQEISDIPTSTSCSSQSRACGNQQETKFCFFSILQSAPKPTRFTRESTRPAYGKGIAQFRLLRIAGGEASPAPCEGCRRRLWSPEILEGLGKDLLLCSETVPDICRTTKLSCAKSLKTNVYQVHTIGGVHASMIAISRRETGDFH
jgi:hypothetical protein